MFGTLIGIVTLELCLALSHWNSYSWILYDAVIIRIVTLEDCNFERGWRDWPCTIELRYQWLIKTSIPLDIVQWAMKKEQCTSNFTALAERIVNQVFRNDLDLLINQVEMSMCLLMLLLKLPSNKLGDTASMTYIFLYSILRLFYTMCILKIF